MIGKQEQTWRDELEGCCSSPGKREYWLTVGRAGRREMEVGSRERERSGKLWLCIGM